MSHSPKPPNPHANRLVRIPEVLTLTGIGHRSTLYRYVRDGAFPVPKRLGKTALAWRQQDILDWIDALPDADAYAGGLPS